MARATRSATSHNQEKDHQSAPAPAPAPARTKASKKRKRASAADTVDEQPTPKHLRTEDSTIKTEDSQELQDANSPTFPILKHAGDVPIHGRDAQKILDILEMIDTQGLLDRVFPLHSDTPSTSSQGSYSFRALLKDSSHFPLHVLRSAVQHLFPISSHPRSRTSTTAAQQLRFCNLALSLLDQASFNSVHIPLDLESIFPLSVSPTSPTTSLEDDSKHTVTTSVPSSPVQKRQYALMQHLPTGDYWTSLNSDFAVSSPEGRELKNLPTAHAELVAILPSPSAPSSSTLSVPTLASYHSKKSVGAKAVPAPARRLSSGVFMDYGPYSSFAPTFDQDGREVGRQQLGEIIFGWEERRKLRTELKGIGTKSDVAVAKDTDVVMADGDDVIEVFPSKKGKDAVHEDVNVDEALEGLLTADDIAAIKSTLTNLELENAVHELLERNKRALRRLEELQFERLSKEDGGTSQVEDNSEEWETAQGIMESLTVLASLRPRSSRTSLDRGPLIPAPSALRKLHRTLPIAPSQGWYGTLPPSRASALRDDSTLKVKSGSASALPVSAATTTLPTADAIVATPYRTPAVGNYASFPYTAYSQQYGSATYGAYKPGQAPSYYPTTYAAQAGQAGLTQVGQSGTQNYYGNQSYAGGTATGQQAYSYPSWFGYSAATAAASTASGRGTPQPASASTITPASYGTFFNGTAATTAATPQQQRTVAVANTVVGNKTYPQAQQAQWSATTGQTQAQVAPTLPPYMRSTSVQPGTPTINTSGYTQQQSYYYQPASAAR